MCDLYVLDLFSERDIGRIIDTPRSRLRPVLGSLAMHKLKSLLLNLYSNTVRAYNKGVTLSARYLSLENFGDEQA